MTLRGRALAAACAVVAVGALVVAVLVSAWALVLLPFAVVFGIAAWRGVTPGTTLRALANTSDDPGSGPAGMVP